MAIVFNQEVVINKKMRNRDYYINMGYKLANENKDIFIPIKDALSNISSEIELTCDLCGGEFKREYNKLKSPNHFCSRECYRKWFAEDWSQRKSWREESRRRAVRILESGLISRTNSACQKTVNTLLDKLNIKYINEYGFEVVAVDNYLVDNNLAIEVMGTYWHCDPRVYETIRYQMQFNRIKHDKRKRMIIKNLSDINILYLWEKDIQERPDICIALIKRYVENLGHIENYHSFNYDSLYSDLILNTSTIKSYFECDIEYLKSIFIPADGKRTSKKQLDKWTTFNCDYCGEEAEQLKSRYNKNKNHHCSEECKKVSQLLGDAKNLGGVKYNCDYCGKEFLARNYLYHRLSTGKRKHLFCSYDCHHNNQRRKGIDSDANGLPYKKEFLISEFFRFTKSFNKHPKKQDFTNNNDYPNVKVYELKWGSWLKFIDSLDIISSEGWYKHDDEVLKKYYLDKDIQIVADKLMVNCTHRIIRSRARKLGLFIKPVNELKITKEDFIEKYFVKKMTKTDIAQENRVTLLMVDKFMKENNIENKGKNKWKQNQTEYLKENYPNGNWDELLKNLQPFDKKAIAKKAYRLGVKRTIIK